MNAQKRTLEQITSFITISIVVIFILSIFLFLSDSQIKFPLFIFGISLAGIFILISFQSDLRQIRNDVSYVKIIDYFLAICATVVFVDNAWTSPPISIIFPLSIIISFFLPGWVLIRFLGISDEKTFKFHFLLISFSVSIGLTSLILLTTISFKENMLTLISGTFAVISLLPILKNSINKLKEKQRSYSRSENYHNLIDVLVLTWITIFFTFTIVTLYPQMSLVPSYDIVRHYSDSKMLIQATDIYSSQYPWFHSPLAVVDYLSEPPMWLFQSGIAFLSIFLIYSFYLMAKAYLHEINRRAHLIATFFFFVFSGFGWFYVIQQKLLSNNTSYLDILKKSYDTTYWDIGYGQGGWLWFWFRPITIGFTLFFMLLYMMKSDDLGKRNYIIIASLLLLTLGQIHFSELLIFVVLIFVVSLLRPTIKLRIMETAISVIISVGATLILTIAYHQFLGWEYKPLIFQYLAFLALLACSTYLLIKFNRRPRFQVKINLILIFVSSTILFIFSIFLMHWLLNPENLSARNFNLTYEVPSEFYPILLGVVGIMAILGSMLVIKKHTNQPVVIFVILLVLALVVGIAITYVNINFGDSGYYERRIIPFVESASAILASIVIILVMKWNKNYTPFNSFKNFLIVVFLSLLVLGGTLSTLYSIESQLLTFPERVIPYPQQQLMRHLSGSNPYSVVLTVTNQSRSILQFEDFAYVIDLFRYQMWPSKSPELTLNVFSSLNGSTIIFIDPNDSKIIASKYSDGYIASHVLKISSTIYQGSEGKILLYPRISPPSSYSDTVLVTSDDIKQTYYAYDILSFGGYNYTTAIESDVSFISKAKTVVVPNEDIALKMLRYSEQYDHHFQKLLVLDLYGNDSKLISMLNVNDSSKISSGHEPNIWSKNYHDLKIFYLDVSQMIQKLNANSTNEEQIFPSLTKSLEMLDVKIPDYAITKRNQVGSLVSGNVFIFKNATFNGNLILKSTSVIVNIDSPDLIIKTQGKSMNFNHISKIIPISTDESLIKGADGIISGGIGFYSHVLLNHSLIHLSGKPATLLLVYDNGTTSTLSSNEIEIISEKSNILIRQPNVESLGMTKFENFYAYGDLNSKLRALNEILMVNGKVSYNVRYSDVSTVAYNSSFAGSVSHSVSISPFDEITSMKRIFEVQNLPYAIIIAVTIMLGNIIFHYRQRLPNT